MISRKRLLFYLCMMFISLYLILGTQQDERINLMQKKENPHQPFEENAQDEDIVSLDDFGDLLYGIFEIQDSAIDRHDDVIGLSNLSNYSLLVTQEMIESLQTMLPETLHNYENPCWYERVPPDFQYVPFGKNDNFTIISDIIQQRCNEQNEKITSPECWRLRCFPSFFLLGVAKSGTTDIYYMLKIFHPNVVTNSFKEPYYWGFRNHKGASFHQYLDLFDYSAEEVRTSTTTNDGRTFHPVIIGDFSPNTAANLPNWQQWPGNINQTEPKRTTAHVIHQIRPETKLILSIRNPVDRLISNFFYTTNRRFLPMEALHNFCKKRISEFNDCVSKHTVRYCVYTSDSVLLTDGLYYITIMDWLDVFSDRQLYVIRFEDYVKDRVQTLNLIGQFLDIGPIPRQYWPNITEYIPHNVNKAKEGREPTPQALIDMLTDFYLPWQAKLEHLLKYDDRLWRSQ